MIIISSFLLVLAALSLSEHTEGRVRQYGEPMGVGQQHQTNKKQDPSPANPIHDAYHSIKTSFINKNSLQRNPRHLRNVSRRIKSSKSNNRHDDDYDYYYYDTNENYHDHEDNVFEHDDGTITSDGDDYYYYDYSSGKGKGSKSTKSTKSSKSSKSSSGKGDNYGPIGRPTMSPHEQSPTTPTMAPNHHGIPTRPRTEVPFPTTSPTFLNNNNNTSPISSPTGGDRDPQQPTTGNNDEEKRCTPDSGGLYGSQLGFAEVSNYTYQLTTIPSVTAEELDLFVLSNVEDAIARGVLERLYEQCNPENKITGTTTSSVSRTDNSDTNTTNTDTPLNDFQNAATPEDREEQGYTLVGDTYVYQHNYVSDNQKKLRKQRRKLLLQQSLSSRNLQTAPQRIEGVSTLPADRVAVGVECVDQALPNLNCFVIRGALTTYTREKQSEETREFIQNAISATLQDATSNLQDADNRLLEVSYRDPVANPIPEMDPIVTDSPTPSPQNVERSNENSFGEPWHYALIAVGGVLILVTIFLCIRRPKSRKMLVSDDEDNIDAEGDGDDSSASEEDESAHDGEHRQDEDVNALNRSPFGVQSQASTSVPSQQDSSKASGIGTVEEGTEEDEDYSDEEEEYEDEDDDEERGDMVDDEEDDETEEEMFEDEPSREEKLDAAVSPFGGDPALFTAGAAAALMMTQPIGDEPELDEETKRSFEVQSILEEEEERQAPPRNSGHSFSAAIARAMTQASLERSENEFQPFQIQDDNIYGATTATATFAAQEYEFGPMNMNSGHGGSTTTDEFEEESYDDGEEEVDEEDLEDDEYEIEYAEDSADEMVEETVVSSEDEDFESR